MITMDIGMIRGLGTLVVMVSFIGLMLWVFSPARKAEFDDATLLPFADDPDAIRKVEHTATDKEDRP
ncbi:Cytochrome c oxidase, cbb3-type, subunit IV [Pseudomonas coronafaciens pv. garcae]|uniref:Cytochrome c oxidase, cbb3-type, subunit IV n=2 Tax=Pseudomonas syringae group TaxID=136849 RepID=A0AB37QM91_9PSED|nr:Cytochrome c oxidase, cbb3-type, subunit IV [Pseudomonas coronafaciens pv. garcae]RMS02350.1 Cytochrome c oxidase, cbb3-type, subunit IV [Pseudomonas coronafaciens pv. garcae]RMV06131.1 Cytochrome c oxidase, cbb3-type, subunit IV [Pseudomonas coronafaciens pv. coronafaciens]